MSKQDIEEQVHEARKELQRLESQEEAMMTSESDVVDLVKLAEVQRQCRKLRTYLARMDRMFRIK